MKKQKKDSYKFFYKNLFDTAKNLFSNWTLDYYMNCKSTTLDPEAISLIGHIFYNRIKPLRINAIGGLTLDADPIAIATAMVSGMQDDVINAFVIRKTAKEHGLMKWFEGNVHEGDKVVIANDIVTTGKSTVKAIHRTGKQTCISEKPLHWLIDRKAEEKI